METGRLLYDDGTVVPCGPTAEKTQRGWRVAGLAAGRLDARLHKRQEDDAPLQLDTVHRCGALRNDRNRR